jgi:hypothetical protein
LISASNELVCPLATTHSRRERKDSAKASFDLGEVGEIAEIQWLRLGNLLTARLKIRVVSYPEEYLKSNASLIRKDQSYEPEIAVERLVAKPLR